MQNYESIKGYRSLVLTNAIFCLVNAIPGLGMVLNFLIGIPSLVVLIMSVIEMFKAPKANQKRGVPILAMVAGTLGFISALMMVVSLILGNGSSSYSVNTSGSSGNPLILFAMLIGVTAWILYVISTIMHFMLVRKLGAIYRNEQSI
ncbi:hypothetical protein [Culicoidibacter larvae]|uniref:Uncharacterized protein n=1 Tax=Culicoidibacter larvae TaxID=2579976 RepID=A0A5R8QHE7_9FIRM|nr:hypothetical protein [Culicoidibacter larvae]TLG77214.1 hypothetical protein FEZ08_00945 [Culicoidibacter larvae]